MPKPDMPIIGGCGGSGQPDCPPQPAAGTLYTEEEMRAHALASYQKGRKDYADELANYAKFAKSMGKGDL